MKRGLITWDRSEIPPDVFQHRWDVTREFLSQHRLDALVVYSDLWRSNSGRFLSNYMPYFNRALLILPASLVVKPTLLCGLSPRVYRWIQSVTPLEDIRPAGDFAKPLAEISSERGWERIGLLEANQLPYDLTQKLSSTSLKFSPVNLDDIFRPPIDETALEMHRKAARLGRNELGAGLETFVGRSDYECVGLLEGQLRMSGAEDVVILLTNGDGVPSPSCGRTLTSAFSISAAVEYRGHWIRLSRPGAVDARDRCGTEFVEALKTGRYLKENMSGAYPYESAGEGALSSLTIESTFNGHRYFYGDTCWQGPNGWIVL